MRHGKPFRRLKGPVKRINLLRNLVTGLVRYERIETSIARAHECQKYAERIIYIAKRTDRDPDAMRIANFWLTDKAQIHKLFKVLGARFVRSNGPFTRLFKVGEVGNNGKMLAYIEFKGNPYPPLRPVERRNPDWLVNVLVRGALQDFRSSGLAARVEGDISNPGAVAGLGEAVGRMKLGASVEGAATTDACLRTSDGDDGTPV